MEFLESNECYRESPIKSLFSWKLGLGSSILSNESFVDLQLYSEKLNTSDEKALRIQTFITPWSFNFMAFLKF